MTDYTLGSQLTAVFVTQGAVLNPRYKEAYGKWNQDGIEFADRLSHAACLIEQVWLADHAVEGVSFTWEYEVSEQVGRWIVDYLYDANAIPDDDTIVAMTKQLARTADNR